jgi:hypothetical protein
VIYLLNVMILSFQDRDTHTSEIKFIKQGGALDLAKLSDISTLHWEVRRSIRCLWFSFQAHHRERQQVMHDKIGVQEASVEISRLMLTKPLVSIGRSCWLGFVLTRSV